MQTIATRTNVLNFIVTGQVRSGMSIVQTSVSAHPQAVCHGELLHADESVRRDVHEDYFGPAIMELPEWFMPRVMSAEQYLTTRVFDHPSRGEKVVGVKVPYRHIQDNAIWEYCRERSQEGDFVVVHVKRNPLACLVSLKQAQGPAAQHVVSDHLQFEVPSPVSLDAKELTEFCRAHAAFEARVGTFFDDRIEIDYRELVVDYRNVMAEVFSFLDLPPYPDVQPGTRMLKNRAMKDRIYNFASMREKVPPDVREFFDHNLF